MYFLLLSEIQFSCIFQSVAEIPLLYYWSLFILAPHCLHSYSFIVYLYKVSFYCTQCVVLFVSFSHSHRDTECCSWPSFHAGASLRQTLMSQKGHKDNLVYPSFQEISSKMSLTELWRGWILWALGFLPKFLIFLNDQRLFPCLLTLNWH